MMEDLNILIILVQLCQSDETLKFLMILYYCEMWICSMPIGLGLSLEIEVSPFRMLCVLICIPLWFGVCIMTLRILD